VAEKTVALREIEFDFPQRRRGAEKAVAREVCRDVVIATPVCKIIFNLS